MAACKYVRKKDIKVNIKRKAKYLLMWKVNGYFSLKNRVGELCYFLMLFLS